MPRRIRLARHPPVAPEYTGICYGSSDVPLAADRIQQAAILAQSLAAEPITHLYHSDLSRCRLVALELAAITGATPRADHRLRERCFGDWEGQRWDEIHAATGEAMMGMVTAPDSWRPPGGETTFELRDRALAWFRELPPDGDIVAITHGGPIAAILGTVRALSVEDWIGLIPACGMTTVVHEERAASKTDND